MVRALSRLPVLVAGSLCLIALAINVAPMIVLFDAIRNFAPQAALAALMLAAAALVFGTPRAALFSATAAVLFALPPAGAAAPEAATAGAPTLTIYLHNIHSGRAAPAEIEAAVRAADPDMVALVESRRRDMRRLAALQARYPHIVQAPDSGPMTLLSKRPLRPLDPQPDGWPSGLYVMADTALGPIAVALVHLSRPWPFNDRQFQSIEMQRLRATLAGRGPDGGPGLPPGRAIVLGDFNASPWGLVALRMRAAGYRPIGGLSGTWPAWGPELIRTPIDNAFINAALMGVGRQVLAPTGSDHIPVVFTVQAAPAR